MLTLLAVLQFEAAKKWLDNLTVSESLFLGGLFLVAIGLGLREAKENRAAGGFREE